MTIAKGYVVTLDQEEDSDDENSILGMLKKIRGVAFVDPVPCGEPPARHIDRAHLLREIDRRIGLMLRKMMTPDP